MTGWKQRTMQEAKKQPFDPNAANSMEGMSNEGVKKFNHYNNVYSQRTKSITAISADGQIINYKKDSIQNYESLSGLRGYRIGPVVPLPCIQDMKEKYQQLGKPINTSKFIREENYSTFDKHLMKEFGFKTEAEAKNWRIKKH